MTPEFRSDLDVVQLDAEHWQLLSPLVYESALPIGEVIVPSGFTTDFASTPRIVWMWMPKSGGYSAAATVHDFLYKMGGNFPGRTYTKADADALFNEALKLLGTKQPQRAIMYSMVKAFGRGNFA
jgi:hypothetical protein